MRLLSRMFLHVVEHSALGRMRCGYKGTLGTREGPVAITDVFHRTLAGVLAGQVKFSPTGRAGRLKLSPSVFDPRTNFFRPKQKIGTHSIR